MTGAHRLAGEAGRGGSGNKRAAFRKNRISAATAVRERAMTFMNYNPSRSSYQRMIRAERELRRQGNPNHNMRDSESHRLSHSASLFSVDTEKATAICTDTRALLVRYRFLRSTRMLPDGKG